MYRGNNKVRITLAFLVALALTVSTINTDIITTNITHSSTMSGGSRLSAVGGSVQSGGAEGSEGCNRRAGGSRRLRSSRGSAEGRKQVCDLWERSGQRAQSCPTGAD